MELSQLTPLHLQKPLVFVVDQPFGVGVRAEASFSMVPASSAVVVVVVERRRERRRRRKKERRGSAIVCVTGRERVWFVPFLLLFVCFNVFFLYLVLCLTRFHAFCIKEGFSFLNFLIIRSLSGD